MSQNGLILVIGKCILNTISGNLPVIFADNVTFVDCPECVVILNEASDLPEIKNAAGLIIDGDCSEALPVDRLSGIQLITCGRCGKNTVCITSDSGETVTLALNRAVETIGNQCDRNVRCEPFEYPVQRQHGASDFGCMAAFAAEVLLQKIMP